MSWLLIAIAGHLCNAVAFVVDKALLNTALKRSATYAALIGTLSFLAFLLIPWVKRWPGPELWPYIFGFGFFNVLALWAFYEGLKRAETSRVVPIVGSLIPVFTLAGTSVVFHEHLTLSETIGFCVLLAATILLSRGGGHRARVTPATFLVLVSASILFALTSVVGKYAFNHGDFMGVLVSSRLVAGCMGLGIGMTLVPVRKEILSVLFPKRRAAFSLGLSALTIMGQLLGAAGFLLVYLAIAQGSAAIVNVLQAVQYAGLVLAAWFGGARLRRLLREERTPKIVAVKSIAIGLVAIGLGLVAHAI